MAIKNSVSCNKLLHIQRGVSCNNFIHTKVHVVQDFLVVILKAIFNSDMRNKSMGLLQISTTSNLSERRVGRIVFMNSQNLSSSGELRVPKILYAKCRRLMEFYPSTYQSMNGRC